MKTKQQKKEGLKELQGKLAKAKIAVFTSFAQPAQAGQQGQKGMNVTDMGTLRKSLRPLDSEYSVEKKTLLDKAIKSERSGLKETPVFSYPGSIGVTYGYGDPFSVLRALYQFSKKNQALKLYGGFMGEEFLDGVKIIELAKLPTKEVLLGQLVGMLSYPIRSLAVVLQQTALKKQ